MRFEVDWGDVGDPEAAWPEASGLPPVDVTSYLDSSWVEAGGGRLGRSTNESTRADGRVAGRIGLTNGGEWTNGRGGTWDDALARPHLFRLRTGPPATARKVQQVGIAELVDSDEETAELSITSRYRLIDGEVPDTTDDGNTVAATTAGNKTVTAFVNAVLTAARVGDSASLQKPTPRVTIADTIRIGAAVDQVEISGRVADTLDDVGLACLGWWSEDWDGCPHFWGLVAAGQAARYATVDGTWRPLVGEGGVSRPTGLLRNQVSLANVAQGAVRVVAGEWDGSAATHRNQARGVAITMAQALAWAAIPALPSGSDISTAEYLDMVAEVSDVDHPNLWTDDTVFIPATVTPRSRATPEPDVTWADWFADYAASRTSSLLYLTLSWTNPALVQEISIRFTVYASVRYNVARGLTVESDRASIVRHGPRAFPSQPDRFAAYGQGGQAATLLNIFTGPPLVADLTIPLWHTAGLSPDPTSLRIGDRLRIQVPGTGWDFDAAILTLRWEVEPGRMPSVRVLALQATGTATVQPDPPNPPTGLTISTAPNSLTLAWAAPVGGTAPTGYRVEWGTTTGYGSSATVTGTSHTITGLTSGTLYYVRVRSVAGSATSAWLAGSATTAAGGGVLQPPNAPGVPTGTPTDTTIPASWAAPSTGGAVSTYSLRYRPGTSGAWTTITGITGTSRTITGLTASTSYQVEVQSVNSAGSSIWRRATFTTAAAGGPPGTPPVLSAGARIGGDRFIPLTWTYTIPDGVTFQRWEIQQQLFGTSTFRAAGSNSVAATRAATILTSRGRSTMVRVRAVFANSDTPRNSGWSNVVTSAGLSAPDSSPSPITLDSMPILLEGRTITLQEREEAE